MTQWQEKELEAGRIHAAAFPDMQEEKRRARLGLASVFNCDARDVAMTHCTTEGINIVLSGMSWQPGDEIITSSTEHPGILHPVYQLHQRYGVRIRLTEIGKPGVDDVAALKAAITPRTRAVALSHVSWSTGVVLPLSQLIEVTHSVGALFLCDGAQSGGMIPLNVRELDVDAYAISGQKWLCGPEGTGGLYVRPDRIGEIQPSYMGYFSVRSGMSDYDGNYVPSQGALRYEATTLNPATVAGLRASLDWLSLDVGWQWAHARIARLGRLCHDALSPLPGVKVLTPREAMAGLVHFTIRGAPAPEAVKALDSGGILVRAIPSTDLIRASVGFYTLESEIALLAERVGALVANQ
ncbi:MAG TPA: aminotransferase class V-fold PLP-dependent enzyme [Ktedonobacterales bacterium]